jgi:hypothetical protein
LPPDRVVGRVGERGDLRAQRRDLLLERVQVTEVSALLLAFMSTHFLDTFVLEMASNPIHSTFARSHAEHAGSFPSHFCLRLRHRVHDEIARATLYCVCSLEFGDSLRLDGGGGLLNVSLLPPAGGYADDMVGGRLGTCGKRQGRD